MADYIYGNFEYCYDGIPVIRGYCSYKTLIKYSKPHPAYQRDTNIQHVEEIKQFIMNGSYKFMPEIILSYDYSGLGTRADLWGKEYYTPFDYLIDRRVAGILKLFDNEKKVEFQSIKSDKINKTIRLTLYGEVTLTVFNRLDGNHRLEALEMAGADDFQIPYCIVLLCSSGDRKLMDREKIEMGIFHNINSKAKPLTPIEQYKGLLTLFTVDELNQFGKEFSLTKAYMEKYRPLRFNNLASYFGDIEDIVLFCIKFFLDRGKNITEDDIAEIFGELEHTFFSDFEVIRNCKSRFAIVPYVYLCYEGAKHKSAKLSAYNTWFISNKLYNVKDIDPASMIDTFNSIYDIRRKRIFVAMPFKEELDFVFDAICEVVDKINYENDTELETPIRIDKQIAGFSYDIVEEIFNNIQNAGLLIADLTYQNANVYYEAGFAQGLIRAKLGDAAKVLYLISNPDEPEKPIDAVKFDIQNYKLITYRNDGNAVAELKGCLEKELKAFYCI